MSVMVRAATVGDHEVVVRTGNGHGSINTCIRRFTTVQSSVGTAITYADSATLGASFTIVEDGLYAIHYADGHNSASAVMLGVSLNSAAGASTVNSLSATERLMLSVTGTNTQPGACSRVVRLLAGDVLRPHTSGTMGGTDSWDMFAIRKVGL